MDARERQALVNEIWRLMDDSAKTDSNLVLSQTPDYKQTLFTLKRNDVEDNALIQSMDSAAFRSNPRVTARECAKGIMERYPAWANSLTPRPSVNV